MSFFPRTGEALAAPRMDYATLVAGLSTRTKATPRGEVASARPEPIAIADDLCLAAVILGHPGWQQAARALGGGFAPRGS